MCMHQHTAHPYITPRTVYKLFVSVWGCFCHFLFVTNLCKFGVLFHVDVSHQNLCHAFLSNDSIFFFFCCFYRWLLSRRQPCQMEMEASEKKTICVNDRRVSSLLGSLKFSLENILFFFSTVFFLYFGSSAYFFFCLFVHSVSSAYISQH